MPTDFDEALETYRRCSDRILRDMRSAFESDSQTHPDSRAFAQRRVAVIDQVMRERGHGPVMKPRPVVQRARVARRE